ncbi:unnamed protein product, partial [marine sediment metagenome]
MVGCLTVAGLLCFSQVCIAANLKQADKLFEKGTYQEALKAYKEVFKHPRDRETKWKAFFRTCESLTHLWRYGEAAQLLTDTPLPQRTSHRARILILRAELYCQFLREYRRILNRDVIDSEDKGVFALTRDEVKSRIEQAFQELWDLRKSLTWMPLSREGYYIEVKNIDKGMYPTVFDYVVLRYSDYLLFYGLDESSPYFVEKQQGKKLPDAAIVIREELNKKVNFKDFPSLLAA